MMIKPTVAELLNKVDNRYTLVIATAKRARQIAQGSKPFVSNDDVATVSIAADELNDGSVTVVKDEETVMENEDNINKIVIENEAEEISNENPENNDNEDAE